MNKKQEECKHTRCLKTLGRTYCICCYVFKDDLENKNKPMEKELRTFDTGANRDISLGKLQTSKYSNALCNFSFDRYMLSKQFINGEWREGDNRQFWIPPDSLFESLCRHIEELKLMYAWYKLVEVRDDKGSTMQFAHEPITDGAKVIPQDIITTFNAIRFNSEALKKHFLEEEMANTRYVVFDDELSPEVENTPSVSTHNSNNIIPSPVFPQKNIVDVTYFQAKNIERRGVIVERSKVR